MALGVVAVLDVGSPTAEAAPSVSPFAGTYVGADPRGWYPSWTVTISDAGQITSSLSSHPASTNNGSISGQVSAGGKYSFTVSKKFAYYPDGERRRLRMLSYKSAGTMTPDADGNIVGTANTGETFSWLRQ